MATKHQRERRDNANEYARLCAETPPDNETRNDAKRLNAEFMVLSIADRDNVTVCDAVAVGAMPDKALYLLMKQIGMRWNGDVWSVGC